MSYILKNFNLLFIEFITLGFIVPSQLRPEDSSNIGYIFIFVFFVFVLFDTKLKRLYKKYSKIKSSSGYTGGEQAKELLKKNNLNNIKVVAISKDFEKELFKEYRERFDKAYIDHYDLRTKTIALSSNIFNSNSLTAISVATHKVSYAMWSSKRKIMSKIRSLLHLTTSLFYIIGFILGLIGHFGRYLEIAFFFNLRDFGFTLLGIAFLLGILNLPIEFYISRKALKLLEENNLLQKDEIKLVKKVLNNIPFIFLMGGGPPELKRLKIYLKKVK